MASKDTKEWPVHTASSNEQESLSGLPSHGQGLEDYLTQLLSALLAQTQAINRLAASNEALIQAMAEDGSMGDDMPVAYYLNGKPAVR